MKEEGNYAKIIEQLNPLGLEVDSPAHQFRADLISAVKTCTSMDGYTVAPYENPLLFGEIRSFVAFPGSNVIKGESEFALVARPYNDDSPLVSMPLIVGTENSLADSGVLERVIHRLRAGNDCSEEDKLVQYIQEVTGKEMRRHEQDFLVDMKVADLLEAYVKEGISSFDNVYVKRIDAIVPVNPDKYGTEVAGLVSYFSGSERESMCFAYTMGDIVYRGRPIIPGGRKYVRSLEDINKEGKNSYFNIESLGALREGSSVDFTTGGMIVVSLPLVGKESSAGISNDHIPSEPFMLGGPSKGGGSFYSTVVSTGRATGTKSRLVPGDFDTNRKEQIGILDIRLVAYVPDMDVSNLKARLN